MRRRGLEPPLGYPGPGPQPGWRPPAGYKPACRAKSVRRNQRIGPTGPIRLGRAASVGTDPLGVLRGGAGLLDPRTDAAVRRRRDRCPRRCGPPQWPSGVADCALSDSEVRKPRGTRRGAKGPRGAARQPPASAANRLARTPPLVGNGGGVRQAGHGEFAAGRDGDRSPEQVVHSSVSLCWLASGRGQFGRGGGDGGGIRPGPARAARCRAAPDARRGRARAGMRRR